MIILGIDPGSRRIGYGLIKKTGNSLALLDTGLLKIKSRDNKKALQEIKKEMVSLIKKWRPDFLSIEKLYFVKNQKTGMDVAEARGVMMLVAAEFDIPVKEYAPNEVKLAVTGYGLADKKAVAKMVRLILNKPKLKVIDDASDALALAIAGSQELFA